MAMFPALMNDTMFSDLFDDPFFEGWRSADNSAAMTPTNMMSTDVRENAKGYDVDIDMPGFKKDDISVSLNNGYLTVSAHKAKDSGDKDESRQVASSRTFTRHLLAQLSRRRSG